MNATMQVLPSHIIKFTDPEELRVIMNELFFNLKNNLGGYERSCYWVAWLIQWEKINKKKKQAFEIEERPIKGLNKKLCRDLIWLVWSVIFEEANLRDDNIKKQIQALFLLYKHNFTSGKRNVRLPYVYHAIGYLTLPIKFNIKVSEDLTNGIKNLVQRGKEQGFILISELDEIIKNLSVPDQQYIRDGMEELKIQVVKTPKDYDEFKYMTGEEAIEFLQSLSDGKTKAFVRDEKEE